MGHPLDAGKPYYLWHETMNPRYFTRTWCSRCKHAGDCQIYELAWKHRLDEDPEHYPKELVHDEHANPTCTAFESQGYISSFPDYLHRIAGVPEMDVSAPDQESGIGLINEQYLIQDVFIGFHPVDFQLVLYMKSLEACIPIDAIYRNSRDIVDLINGNADENEIALPNMDYTIRALDPEEE